VPIQWADIPIDQDADFSGIATWLAGGVPPSFAGAAARLQARILKTDLVPVISISTTPNAQGSLTLVSGTPAAPPVAATPSQITVAIDKAATITIPCDLSYELFVDWADGTSITFLEGRMRLNKTGTR
jgi:hypothetical protein